MRFWRHAIVTAMIARSVARRMFNFMPIDPESAFCGGILHDIGRLIFQQYVPDECRGACEYARSKNVALIDAEAAVLGTTHARIGSILADKWALPMDLENALVFHHRPAQAPSGRELVSIVHLADIVCHSAGVDLWDGEPRPAESPDVRDFLKIGTNDYEALLAEARESTERSDEFFTIIR